MNPQLTNNVPGPFNFAPIPASSGGPTNQPSTAPQTGSGLDPTIVNLSKAIRQVESNNNPTAKGKSGEYGYYQYTPDTWNAASSKYLGQQIPLEQASPAQQNEVTVKRLSDLKAQHPEWNVGNFASAWNAGEHEPNAYTGQFSDGRPSVGVNSYGVHYDVPTYAKNVATSYQKFKGGANTGTTPQIPSASWKNPFQNDTPNPMGATFPHQAPATGGDNYWRDVGAGIKSDPWGVALAGLKGGAQAVGNFPSSLFQIGKGLGQAVLHPIKTVTSLGNVIAGGGEAVGRKILEQTPLKDKVDSLPFDKQEEVFNAFRDSLKQRGEWQLLFHPLSSLSGKNDAFQNLENYAVNSPAQFGLDVVMAVQAAAKVADVARNVSSGLGSAQETLAKDITNNTKMYDNYIGSGDMNPSAVYKDIGGKIYQPEIAQHIIGDAQQALTQVGHADLGQQLVDTLASQSPNYSKITPELITNTVQDLINQKGSTFSNAVNSGIGTVGQTAIKPVKAVGTAIANTVGGGLGISSTVGAKTGASALRSALESGDARAAYQEAMRGNYTPDQIVEEANNGLDSLLAKRSAAYQEQLQKIAGNTKSYDISLLNQSLQDNLQKFGITVSEDGELDFSRSAIANSGPARADVQGVYDTLKNWGTKPGDRTAIGLDTLKQQLGDFYSPSSQARAFVQGVKSSLWNPSEQSGILSQVDGYGQLTGDYTDASNYIKDLKSSLSIGGRAGVETTFNKLIQGIKGNSTLKAKFVNELNQETGGTLIPHLSGAKMTQVFPGGLMGQLEGAGGFYGLLSGAIGIKELLPLLTIASPRVVGEFFNALGLGKQVTSAVLKYLSTPIKAGLYGGQIKSSLGTQNQ